MFHVSPFICLTLYALMDSSFWFDAINLGWSIVYIEGSQVITTTLLFLFDYLRPINNHSVM